MGEEVQPLRSVFEEPGSAGCNGAQTLLRGTYRIIPAQAGEPLAVSIPLTLTSRPTMTSRRNAMKKIAVASATVGGLSLAHRIEAAEAALAPALKGRVNHSVCRWCYRDISLEDLCQGAKNI